MYLLFRKSLKMKQYNIYAGLNGSFGGASYQYTTLAESYEEAEQEAYEAACDEYESMAGLHGLYDIEDCIEEYCSENNLERDELDEEDLAIVDETYIEERENWLDYKAVLTEEDNIGEDDLILGYIVEDDSPDQTNSK